MFCFTFLFLENLEKQLGDIAYGSRRYTSKDNV